MPKFYVDPDIAKAKSLHPDFYKNRDCFEAAKERIFRASWQFIGPVDAIQHNGDCYPFVLLENYLDEPLVLTNDNGHIRCLSNACTHRANLVVNEPCKLSRLTCSYHGRQFSLDGKFQSMPGFEGVEDFPAPADNLRKLPFYQFGKLLFTSIHTLIPASDFFGEMTRRLHWLPVDEFIFRPEISKDYPVQAHWAIYCENYLEGLHIPYVHPSLHESLDFGHYSTEIYHYSSLQIGLAKEGEPCFDLPESSVDFGKKVAAYYYFIFPNLMLNFYPWGLSVNLVKPQTPSTSVVSFYSYVWKEGGLKTGAVGDLDVTEKEDEAFVEAVQKGVQSSFYKHGRYSVKHEKGTHHFHRLIAEMMDE